MKKTLFIWISAICFCIVSFFVQRAYFSHRESETAALQEEAVETHAFLQEVSEDSSAQGVFIDNNIVDLGNNCIAYLVPNDAKMLSEFMSDKNFTGDQYIAIYALDFGTSVNSDGDVYYLPNVYGNITEMKMEESGELYLQYVTSTSGETEEVRIPFYFPTRMTEDFLDMDAHASYMHYKKQICASQEVLMSGEESIFPQTVWTEGIWVDEEQYEVTFERVSPIYDFFAEHLGGHRATYRLTVKDANGNVVWERKMLNYPVVFEEPHWFVDFTGDGYLDMAFCTFLYWWKADGWFSTLYVLTWNPETDSFEESALPEGDVHLWNEELSSLILTVGSNKEMYSFFDGEWKRVRGLEALYSENEYYEGTNEPVIKGYRELFYSQNGEIIEERMLEIDEVLRDDSSVWSSDNAENLKLYPYYPIWQEENTNVGGIDVYKYVKKVFGAVPYFDEDTDGLLQYADGWLYGYLGGRVFRMDAETGEVSVLFETAGTRSIHFCIDNGCLYFLYIPQVTFVDGARADLYRMNCDGTGLVLLAEAIPVAESGIYNGERKIQMSVYEDILYIMRNDEVTCFHLLADGSVKEAALEDTLYGLIPDGYFPPYIDMRRKTLPSIPYSAAHYGYFFVCNEGKQLLRIDADSGQWERVTAQTDYDRVFVTHEGIYLSDDKKQEWTRYDLEDVTEYSTWLEYDTAHFDAEIVGWEENGVFFIRELNDKEIGFTMQLFFIDWEGNEMPLVSFEKQGPYAPPYSVEHYYVRNNWLYYRDGREDDYWLMRVSLAGGEPEMLYCYDMQPGEGITEEETVEKNAENTGEIRISSSITKLWLKEDEEGAAEINAALRAIYEAAEADMETENQEILDIYLFEDGEMPEDLEDGRLFGYSLDEWLAITEDIYKVFIVYVDENYLCLGLDDYTFVAGGAHGWGWTDYYVFDRHTGQRLSLEDFVSDSPEEIKEIVKVHIIAAAPYSDGEQAEDALEQDRFFLTAEGLGIHYDVYEIGDHAAGTYDIIIPFAFFTMKEGMR